MNSKEKRGIKSRGNTYLWRGKLQKSNHILRVVRKEIAIHEIEMGCCSYSVFNCSKNIKKKQELWKLKNMIAEMKNFIAVSEKRMEENS